MEAPQRAEAPDRGVDEPDADLGEGPQVEAAVHEVVAGDNLWKIAEQVLTATWGRAPTATEISVYWWELIDRNLPGLRSGDPDLIYPGERFALPATPADARGGQP